MYFSWRFGDVNFQSTLIEPLRKEFRLPLKQLQFLSINTTISQLITQVHCCLVSFFILLASSEVALNFFLILAQRSLIPCNENYQFFFTIRDLCILIISSFGGFGYFLGCVLVLFVLVVSNLIHGILSSRPLAP